MTFTRLPREPQAQYTDVRCDRCDTLLAPIFTDGEWLTLNPVDGLVIEMKTGYGMAYDPLGKVRPVVLCGGCTEVLLTEHPYLRKVLMQADEF